MTLFTFKGKKLTNWKSFHKEFKQIMGFPDYYGENMNAWIDCMDDLSDAYRIVIHIENGGLVKKEAPDILEAIFECAAFVNNRKVVDGKEPNIIISTSYR